MDAALQGAPLVAAEVEPRPLPQNGEDVLQMVARRLGRQQVLRPGPGVRVAEECEHRLGHTLGGQDLIDGPGGDRAARHAVVLRGARILRDRHPARRLYRLEAESAVMAAPREHDADCVLGLVLGQRHEKDIDRRPLALRGSGAAKLQPPPVNGQDCTGREHIDMFSLDLLAVLGLDDRHSGGAAEDFG